MNEPAYGTSYLQDVGKEREHDRMDAGDRAKSGTLAEERKLWRNGLSVSVPDSTLPLTSM